MNIFFLDRDPRLAAEFHCDKHVVKMITEYAQILSTVLRSTGVSNKFTYKKTHQNHPCTKWASMSMSHWRWLRELALFLSQEYTRRYSKVHLASRKLWLMPKRPIMPDLGWVCDPPQVTGGIELFDDCVLAYRECYMVNKAHFATWRFGAPKWFTDKSHLRRQYEFDEKLLEPEPVDPEQDVDGWAYEYINED